MAALFAAVRATAEPVPDTGAPVEQPAYPIAGPR